MAYVILNLVCVAALVGIDQAIKLWATQYSGPCGGHHRHPACGGAALRAQSGMAFSLLSGKQLFLILATSAALLLVAYLLFFRSRGKLLQQIAFILVLAGGIGNLIDRVLNGESWTTSTRCSSTLQSSTSPTSSSASVWRSGCW